MKKRTHKNNFSIYAIILFFLSHSIFLFSVYILITKNMFFVFFIMYSYEYMLINRPLTFGQFILSKFDHQIKYDIFCLYSKMSFNKYNRKFYVLLVVLNIMINILFIINSFSHVIIKNDMCFFFLLVMFFTLYLLRFFYLLCHALNFIMLTEDVFCIFKSKNKPMFKKEEFHHFEHTSDEIKYFISEDETIRAVFVINDKNNFLYEPNLGLYKISEIYFTSKVHFFVSFFFFFSLVFIYFSNLEWIKIMAIDHVVNNIEIRQVISIEMIIRKWYSLFIAALMACFYLPIFLSERNIINNHFVRFSCFFLPKNVIHRLLHFYVYSLISGLVLKINCFFLILKTINLIIISLVFLYQTKTLFFLAILVTLVNSMRLFWIIPKRLYKLQVNVVYNDILHMELPSSKFFSELGFCESYEFFHIGYNPTQKEYFWVNCEYITPFYQKINHFFFFFS